MDVIDRFRRRRVNLNYDDNNDNNNNKKNRNNNNNHIIKEPFGGRRKSRGERRDKSMR